MLGSVLPRRPKKERTNALLSVTDTSESSYYRHKDLGLPSQASDSGHTPAPESPGLGVCTVPSTWRLRQPAQSWL